LRQDFASAYEQHVPAVYGFIAYRVRSRTDAEDLTQATFERALSAWRQYDETRGSLRTWLLAIARNVMVDHHRRGPDRAEEPVDALTVGRELLVDPEEPTWGLDPALAAALEALAQRDREIVALRFGADLAGPEIAALTGLTLANVQQILSRSLRRLRDALEAAEPVRSQRPRRARYGARGPLPAAPRAATASSALPESA
jgi:RNA polymerase sigma-70 factor, ECF subfamily